VPDSPAHDAAIAAAVDGLPIAVPTPVLSEVAFGVAQRADIQPALVNQYEWLLDLIERSILQPLPLTVLAASVAGELRARQPAPPTGDRKRGRAKPEQRVGWFLDLMIAATAWVHGCDIVSRNTADFERIAELLPAPDDDSRLLATPPAFDA
jgi:predicted nucleic acid-binding protein